MTAAATRQQSPRDNAPLSRLIAALAERAANDYLQAQAAQQLPANEYNQAPASGRTPPGRRRAEAA